MTAANESGVSAAPYSPRPSDGAPTEAASARVQRGETGPTRRTVAFVVVFLVSVFVFMTGYRMAVDTYANYVYLHAVAKHTAWALSWMGESSELERARYFRGQEQFIRDSLAALLRGESPPVAEAVVDLEAEPTGPPLTSWELYLYRTERHRRDLEIEEQYLAALAQPHGKVIDSPESHLAAVRERLEQVEKTVNRPGPGDGALRVGQPDVLRELPQLRIALDTLDPVQTPRETFVSTLEQTMHRIEELRRLQQAFIEDRIARMRDRIDDWGPTVTFVARDSAEGRMDALSRELDALRTSDKPPTISEARRIATIRAEIELLRAGEARAQEQGLGSHFRSPAMFTFTVVPDCGAIPSMAIFAAAVLAFPCRWWKRLAGLAAGVPILYAVNVGRLACLGYIGAIDSGGQVFTFIHEYVWQGIFIIFVVVVWLVWVKVLVSESADPRGTSA